MGKQKVEAIPPRELPPLFQIYLGFCVADLHHATHTRLCCGHHRLLLGLIDDEALRGEEHASDGCCVLQGYASHLGRVDDTSCAEILVDVLAGIVTVVALALADLINHHGTLATSVGDNLAQRLLDSAADDVDTRLLVGILTLEVGEYLLSADVG